MLHKLPVALRPPRCMNGWCGGGVTSEPPVRGPAAAVVAVMLTQHATATCSLYLVTLATLAGAALASLPGLDFTHHNNTALAAALQQVRADTPHWAQQLLSTRSTAQPNSWS